MQGLTVVFDLHRITWQDDDVGGAVQTGTVLGSNLRGIINVRNPSQLALEQGLETPVLADVIIRGCPPSITIIESDQVEIVAPSNHPFFGERWRVEGVSNTPMHPSNRRTFVKLLVSRAERSRSEALM